MQERLTIDKTLLTADAPDGAVLSTVTFAEPAGGCGIARDGAAIPDHRWPLDDMPDCTATFLRFVGLGP